MPGPRGDDWSIAAGPRRSGPPRSGPQRYQRDRNLSLVMSALREHGPASRSELAAALSLDRSTLTHLSNELLAAGLIVETDQGPAGSRGGRRPRPLRLNPDTFVVTGVDVRAQDAEWVLLRLDGSVLRRGFLQRGASDGLEWLQTVAKEAAIAAGNAQNGGSQHMLGVGVSVPGLVDSRSGVLHRSVALGLESVRLRELWPDEVSPLLIDNDANCSAWSIATHPDGPRNIVVGQIRLHRSPDGRFLPSGAGIGLAFVFDGRIHYGSRGAAGELRGVGWNPQSADQLGLRLDQIQAREGEPAALRILAAEVIRNLSVVVSVLDPESLVLTGDTELLAPVVDELLSGELSGSPVAELARHNNLSIAPPDEYPAAQGAASMVLGSLFGFGHDGWQPIIDQVAARR